MTPTGCSSCNDVAAAIDASDASRCLRMHHPVPRGPRGSRPIEALPTWPGGLPGNTAPTSRSRSPARSHSRCPQGHGRAGSDRGSRDPARTRHRLGAAATCRTTEWLSLPRRDAAAPGRPASTTHDLVHRPCRMPPGDHGRQEELDGFRTLLVTSLDAGVDLRDVQIAARHADPHDDALRPRPSRPGPPSELHPRCLHGLRDVEETGEPKPRWPGRLPS